MSDLLADCEDEILADFDEAEDGGLILGGGP